MDGTQAGDLIKHIHVLAEVYSKYFIASYNYIDNGNYNDTFLIQFVDAINLNSGEYDDDAFTFTFDYKYNRLDRNITSLQRNRRLLLSYPSSSPTASPTLAPSMAPSFISVNETFNIL